MSLTTQLTIFHLLLSVIRSKPIDVFEGIVSAANCYCQPFSAQNFSKNSTYYLTYLSSYNAGGRLATIKNLTPTKSQYNTVYELKFENLEIGLIEYKRTSEVFIQTPKRRNIARSVYNTCQFNMYLLDDMYQKTHQQTIFIKETFKTDLNQKDELVFKIMWFAEHYKTMPYQFELTFKEDIDNSAEYTFSGYKVHLMEGLSFESTDFEPYSLLFESNSLRQAIKYGLPKLEDLQKGIINFKDDKISSELHSTDTTQSTSSTSVVSKKNGSSLRITVILLSVVLGIVLILLGFVMFMLRRKKGNGQIRNRMKNL
eukprot:GAHX01000296.1.p1 GENE.GAHX01000296.1~~GAHX01000296.1.p1  ORF type:complete len:327 (+),score=53.83 GAHX01000296.1:43-981(+)